jgi:MHS family proline/betaine transporter-like MFS transporter
MPTYATKELGMPAAQSFAMVVVTGGLQFVLSPVVGALSDRFGRLGIMLGTSVATALLIYPMFFMLRAHPTIGWLFVLQAASGLLKAGYSGPMPALLAEIFPTRIRSRGLSLGYSLGVTLFGGLAPFIITWIIDLTGDKLAPSYYVLAAAFVSGLSLLIVARRSGWTGRFRRFEELEANP